MSAKIAGINAPPEWTYWTLDMAPPSVFTETHPISKTIVYDGSILGGGISPGGDTIREIRVFIDVNSYPVATFTPAGVIEDGKSYLFDFSTGILSGGIPETKLLPYLIIGGAFAVMVVAIIKRRK